MGRHAPAHTATVQPVDTVAALGGDLKNRELDRSKAQLDQDVTIPVAGQSVAEDKEGWMGQLNARVAIDGGIVQGVAPVALPLPAYDRSIVITRELVTRDRPLTLRLVYVTTAGVAPLVGLWLVCLAWLLRLYSVELVRLVRLVRERLARRPESDPATPAPIAPPPVVA